MMAKFAVITVIVILSFFINLLYYTCWMLTDHWLLEQDKPPVEEIKVSTQDDQNVLPPTQA